MVGRRKAGLNTQGQCSKLAAYRRHRHSRLKCFGWRRQRLVRHVKPRGKCLETRLHAHAAAPDGGFKLRAAKGQSPGSGQCAIQRRADQAAAFFRELGKVCADEMLGGGASALHQFVRADAAIAHGSAFGH